MLKLRAKQSLKLEKSAERRYAFRNKQACDRKERRKKHQIEREK